MKRSFAVQASQNTGAKMSCSCCVFACMSPNRIAIPCFNVLSFQLQPGIRTYNYL